LTKQTLLSLRKNVCWHALKRARYVELSFRVCVLNRTSVYLHSFVYVIDHLRTAIFILAKKALLLYSISTAVAARHNLIKEN